MALDRSNTLFVNVFHAGSDRDRLGVHKFTLGADGRLRRGAQTPVAMHYNGPAKVVFEAAWGLEQQWDPHSGKTPVLLHLGHAVWWSHSIATRHRWCTPSRPPSC